MASNFSTDIQLSSLTTIDELGELEITEFDATVLKELLKDPNEELQDSTEMGKDLPKEEKSIDGSLDNVQDFNWLDILEESPFPCEDVMIWYADLCTDEMISGVFETREIKLNGNKKMHHDVEVRKNLQLVRICLKSHIVEEQNSTKCYINRPLEIGPSMTC